MRQCCLKWKEVSLCCEGIEIDNKKPREEKQQQREEKWNENGSAAKSYESRRFHEPATELSSAETKLDSPQPTAVSNHRNFDVSAQFLLETNLRYIFVALTGSTFTSNQLIKHGIRSQS